MSETAHVAFHRSGVQRKSSFREWLGGVRKMASIHNTSNATHIFYTIAAAVLASILSTLLVSIASRVYDTGGSGIALEHRLTGIEDQQRDMNRRLDRIDRKLTPP